MNIYSQLLFAFFKWESAGKIKPVSDCDKFLLNGIPDRYSLILAFLPAKIFLFTCGVNSFFTGCKLGGSQRTKNITGCFLKAIQPQESLGVNCNKEMTQVVRNLLAIFPDAGQQLQILPACRAAESISTTVA
jgi:hypothetical protein